MALAIRKAWYFAYFVLEDVSASSGSHICRNSRNTIAARKVSAVWLVLRCQADRIKDWNGSRTVTPCSLS